MATSTIFTNINISNSDEVELFLDALEKSESLPQTQSKAAVEYTEDSTAIDSLLKKAESLDV